MVLVLVASRSVADRESPWFPQANCRGQIYTLKISLDDSVIYQAYGPVCFGSIQDASNQMSDEMLTVTIEPNREISWAGNGDEPSTSPANSVLTVDLWIAGTSLTPMQWTLGLLVRDKDRVYTGTFFEAHHKLNSEICLAPKFCVSTHLVRTQLMASRHQRQTDQE